MNVERVATDILGLSFISLGFVLLAPDSARTVFALLFSPLILGLVIIVLGVCVIGAALKP